MLVKISETYLTYKHTPGRAASCKLQAAGQKSIYIMVFSYWMGMRSRWEFQTFMVYLRYKMRLTGLFVFLCSMAVAL